MKTSFLAICFLMGLALVARCQTQDILSASADDATSLQFNHQAPLTGEDVRIAMTMTLKKNLGLTETSTTICFKTADDTFAVASGDKAFGVQFMCGLTECKVNYYLGAYLFGSEAVVDANGVHWAASTFDVSYTNRGVATVGDGQHPDTMYGMTEEQFASSNLPAENEDVYMKCYHNSGAQYGKADMTLDISLESAAENATVWTSSEVHLVASSE